MSHEARINEALRQLGEEFRLGMVQAEEFRSRRRALLESWGEIEATTSPGALRARAAAAADRAAAAPAPRSPGSRVPLAIVGGVAVLLAIGGYLATRPGKSGPATMPGNAAAAPVSPQVTAAGRAADQFLAANAWDEQGIGQFLGVWRSLTRSERAQAAELPPLVSLRHKLDENIQAESQLAGPDTPPESRARLTLLENFARELSGEGP